MQKIIKYILFCIVIIFTYTAHSASEFIPLPVKRPEFKKIDTNFLILEVKSGDTLSGILEDAGINKSIAAMAIMELKNIYDPGSLKIGQKVKVNFELGKDSDQIEFVSMLIRVSPQREVEVLQVADKIFISQNIIKPLKTRLAKAYGTIDSTLFGSAINAGIPNKVLSDLIKLYSYDIDFQRDIRKGNSFSVIFEELIDEEENKIVDSGNIISASLNFKNKSLNIYRYKTIDGRIDYYSESGESIRKSLLRTPVDGARITSGYGKRRHPILGYNKLHKGIDFGAPTGTPIYTAGDGIVKKLGRNGGYGKYIKIKHANGYSTAYAHLSRYARKLRKGSRVKQGQVIGYVGSTGRSTGPHLHYEVLVNNRQINPLSVKTVPGKKLKNLELAIFKQYIRQVANLEDTILLAKKN